MSTRISHWFRLMGRALSLSRPLSWAYAAVPIIWAIMLQSRQFTWAEFWLWLGALFFLNFFMRAVNAYYSEDGDAHNPKPVLFNFMRWSCLLMLGVTAFASPDWDWYARGAWLAYLVLIWVIGAEPLRWAKRIWLDGLSAALGVGAFFFAWWPARAAIGDFRTFVFATVIFALWLIAAKWLSDVLSSADAKTRATVEYLGQTNAVRASWLIFLCAMIIAIYQGWYWLALGLAYFVFLCYRSSAASADALRRLSKWFNGGAVIFGAAISGAILWRQPDWTYWYYGGYFIGTVALIAGSWFWANWSDIHAKYIAPIPKE